ncbi:MAG: hypothetical protein AB1633_12930 [Elusimicrobiota bacterium]
MKSIIASIFIIFSTHLSAQQVIKVKIPQKEPLTLKPHATISFEPINECSGLVQSKIWKGVFWVHNDSEDTGLSYEARIFAIDINGNILKPKWFAQKYKGILIPEAVNIDWEAITTDDKGNLIIGDIGNNDSLRKDLALYVVPEPYPWGAVATGIISKIVFHYPQQKKIPPDKMNFDAESLFYANGKIYLLTKHRSDPYTSLYRFDSIKPGKSNPVTYISSFDAGSMVTDADVTADGRKLAVLTYDYIWLFEKPKKSDNYFKGKIRYLPIQGTKRCEGIAFDGNFLIITNEERDIFKVDVSSFIQIK